MTEITKVAQTRVRWKGVADGLCSTDLIEGLGLPYSGNSFRALMLHYFVNQLPISTSFAFVDGFLTEGNLPRLSKFLSC